MRRRIEGLRHYFDVGHSDEPGDPGEGETANGGPEAPRMWLACLGFEVHETEPYQGVDEAATAPNQGHISFC